MEIGRASLSADDRALDAKLKMQQHCAWPATGDHGAMSR
jgi:hypothetical protein